MWLTVLVYDYAAISESEDGYFVAKTICAGSIEAAKAVARREVSQRYYVGAKVLDQNKATVFETGISIKD